MVTSTQALEALNTGVPFKEEGVRSPRAWVEVTIIHTIILTTINTTAAIITISIILIEEAVPIINAGEVSEVRPALDIPICMWMGAWGIILATMSGARQTIAVWLGASIPGGFNTEDVSCLRLTHSKRDRSWSCLQPGPGQPVLASQEGFRHGGMPCLAGVHFVPKLFQRFVDRGTNREPAGVWLVCSARGRILSGCSGRRKVFRAMRSAELKMRRLDLDEDQCRQSVFAKGRVICACAKKDELVAVKNVFVGLRRRPVFGLKHWSMML